MIALCAAENEEVRKFVVEFFPTWDMTLAKYELPWRIVSITYGGTLLTTTMIGRNCRSSSSNQLHHRSGRASGDDTSSPRYNQKSKTSASVR